MGRIEALQQRWEDYRPTKGQAIGLAIGCVMAVLALGFGAAGWVSNASAQKMVAEAADNARNQLAAAVCADKFLRADNAGARLAKLNDAGWYDRNELVAKGGWATMPDRKEPDSAVAGMCASLLADKKT
jgi:hypothetical protein